MLFIQKKFDDYKFTIFLKKKNVPTRNRELKLWIVSYKHIEASKSYNTIELWTVYRRRVLIMYCKSFSILWSGRKRFVTNSRWMCLFAMSLARRLDRANRSKSLYRRYLMMQSKQSSFKSNKFISLRCTKIPLTLSGRTETSLLWFAWTSGSSWFCFGWAVVTFDCFIRSSVDGWKGRKLQILVKYLNLSWS